MTDRIDGHERTRPEMSGFSYTTKPKGVYHMDNWKERLKDEYKELKERLDKLHKWNVKRV